MSKGGGGGGSSTQVQQTQLPEWVNNGAMQNWSMAKDAASGLMKPYEGDRVADMPAGMQQLINMLQGNVGSTNPAFQQAQDTTKGLLGFDPSKVDPRMLASTDLNPYMNPYTKNVIDPTMTLMEQSRRQALGQVGDQATQARAFGGSRHGITEGVTNAQSELMKGQFAGGLLGQNFAQAQAAATGDIGRDLQAQLANQAAGLQGAAFRGGMANQLAGLAQAGQNTWLQGMQAAMGGQGLLQDQSQRELDAQRDFYEEQKQYPLQQLQIRQNALGVSPYGQTTYSSRPEQQEDIFGKILGGAGTLAGIAGKVAPLFGPLSDRREKTDIQKLGKDGLTGLPIYAFRYKGDPKTYPKMVGPMAQDVKKKYPEAVIEVGGRLALNGNMLAGMSHG